MEKRIHLLPQTKQYKANLHTHSRLSDGALTPKEVKDLYKAAGYHILAITDHNIMADHSELTENDFLMLTGAEFDVAQPEYRETKGRRGKNYHLCMIAKRPDNLWQPFPMKRIREFSVPYVEKSQPEDMLRVYDLEAVNNIIARANEKGFLVTYNHPVWSLHEYPDWSGLKGLWGMEICNSGCLASGHAEHNEGVFQTMLRLGMRVVPVGASDMHSPQDAKSGMVYYDKAWCMVCASKLDYDSVIHALEQGDCYASTGPEIHSLTWEDGVLRVNCSDARCVRVETHFRPTKLAIAQGAEGVLNEAEFNLSEWLETEKETPNAYFRVVVEDVHGNYAATRAYWLDELQ